MFTFFVGGFGTRRKINLSIGFDQEDYDLFVAAGSPADPVDVVVTVATGIVVSSSLNSIPSFSTGTGWALASTLTLINDGELIGLGGDGGIGGTSTISSADDGVAGVDGGDALEMLYNLSVDNTNGNIFGAGGGGGGGGAAVGSNGDCASNTHAGSGGGGGAGSPGGSGGGSASFYGLPGTDGTIVGGDGGVAWGPDYAGVGVGPGGDGGDYGEDGTAGASGISTGNGCGYPVLTGLGGTAGLGGAAIILNGNTLTWLGGNEPAKVKGAVS